MLAGVLFSPNSLNWERKPSSACRLLWKWHELWNFLKHSQDLLYPLVKIIFPISGWSSKTISSKITISYCRYNSSVISSCEFSSMSLFTSFSSTSRSMDFLKHRISNSNDTSSSNPWATASRFFHADTRCSPHDGSPWWVICVIRHLKVTGSWYSVQGAENWWVPHIKPEIFSRSEVQRQLIVLVIYPL